MCAGIAGARRLVVKVGSSSLTAGGQGIDDGRIDGLVGALAARANAGVRVVLVSSGAIAAGLAPLGLARRPRDLATLQAAASVGQGLLVARYAGGFARHGLRVGQVLLTADDITRRSHYRNAQRTFDRLLDLGVVPVVNENDTVATEEIRFGDNDRLAALVAHLVRADALVLLSDVAGVYRGGPRNGELLREVHPGEELVDVIDGAAGSPVGTGGIVTKLAAARLATAAGVPVVVAHADAVADVLGGAPLGTYFHPTGRRVATRLLWLAHAAAPRGNLVLDPGAVRAVVERRSSLLPAGLLGAAGSFVAGDPVDLVDQAGTVVARGIVEYDASEMPALFGRSTRELATALGPSYAREVVHRDDLVVLADRSPGVAGSTV